MARLSRRVHRWLGLAVAVPVLLWTGTGLLFHFKPGWDRAYEQLSCARPKVAVDVATLKLPHPSRPPAHLEVMATALGPLVVTRDARGRHALYDRSGVRRSPLSKADAEKLVHDAVAQSPLREQYGQPGRVVQTRSKVTVHYSEGPRVSIHRHSGKVTHTGPDRERIDWLYRLHYLKWTGNGDVDPVLVMLAIATAWGATLFGVWLMWSTRRRRRA